MQQHRLIGSFSTKLVLLLVLLFLGSSVQSGSVKVTVAGATEKIDAFDKNDITYICFSDLVEITGGQLDWQIIGHQISYIAETNRMDFYLESPFMKLNDTGFNLTFPATYKEGKLYLPAETFMPLFNQISPEYITFSDSKKTIRIDSEYFNVTDMAVSEKANGLLIEIFLTGTVNYDVFVSEGDWVNISIRDGQISPRIKNRKDSRYMYKLKTHQESGVGQISMRLKRKVERWHHKLVLDPPRIQLSIPDLNFELDTGAIPVTELTDNKIDVIVIDAGHGGKHYGAIGPRGTREKDIALNIARELAKLVRKDKQFKVVMTRDRDETVSLEKRADIANKASADLFVSIHANSSLKKNVRGWNVFFLAPARNDSARAVAQFENSAFVRDFTTDDDVSGEMTDPVLSILNEMLMTEFQAESADFAMMMDREFRSRLKIPARGVDQAGFVVLNQVFCPSVLVESGFISNKTEEKLLKKRDYQKKVARGIYEAVKRFKAKYENM